MLLFNILLASYIYCCIVFLKLHLVFNWRINIAFLVPSSLSCLGIYFHHTCSHTCMHVCIHTPTHTHAHTIMVKSYNPGYPPLAFFLNKTGRPVFLSTEYPLYQKAHGIKVSDLKSRVRWYITQGAGHVLWLLIVAFLNAVSICYSVCIVATALLCYISRSSCVVA